VEALSIQACNTSFGASPELAATIFPFPSKILIYSQPNRQKLRNIERNPRVGLNLNSKARGGDDVARVEGVAEIVREAPPATEVPEYVDKVRESIARIGLDEEGFARAYSVAVRVTPERRRVW
jgi:PPOX class probable F420-dependent enzyme